VGELTRLAGVFDTPIVKNEKCNMNRQTARRRSFGSIRQISGGRYQARYTAPDHTLVNVKGTFATKQGADQALARIRVEMMDRRWSDPRTKRPTLSQFVPSFLASRQGRSGDLKPKTLQLYRSQLDRYLLPAFGTYAIDEIDVGMVNRWHASLPGGTTLKRQLYALLKSIVLQAVEEEIIQRSPCRLKGAGQNRYQPRPPMSPEQADRILANLAGDIWMLGQLAYDTHLRLGEVLALTWLDIDLENQILYVRHSVSEVANKQLLVTPKNGEERRVAFEIDLVEELQAYRNRRAPRPKDRLFLRLDGSPLRHYHVHTAWNRARKEAGLPQFRFHDLRHTGLTQASDVMPMKSVMARGGHKTTAAALNYQHLAEELQRRDSRKLADAKAKRRILYGTPMAKPESIRGQESQNAGAA
jgi:integrase